MNLVRKLVYAKTEAEFAIEYHNFQNHVSIKNYNNFSTYITNIGCAERNGQFVSGMQHTREVLIQTIMLNLVLEF